MDNQPQGILGILEFAEAWVAWPSLHLDFPAFPQMGDFTAHAASWTGNVASQLRVPSVAFPDKLHRVASIKGKPLSPSTILPQGENPLSSPPPQFLLQHPVLTPPVPMLCPGHSSSPPQNTPPLNARRAASPRPIDYTGENLAFIDESSDTLSEGGPPSTRLPRRWRPRARHRTDPAVPTGLPMVLLSRTRDKGESV